MQSSPYEIDRDLAAALRAEAIPNVTHRRGRLPRSVRDAQSLQSAVHQSNRSQRRPQAHGRQPCPAVAGNLPYNVASPILFRLAELYASGLPIADAIVMLQREVAERLVAPHGSGEYGVLSVLMQHVAESAILIKLPPGAFRPMPKVHSALVRLRFHARRPAGRRSRHLRRCGAGRVHAAPQNARERAEGLPSRGGGAGGHRSAAPAGNTDGRGVRAAGRLAEKGRVAYLSCAIIFGRKSFSPPYLVSGAPSSLIEPRIAAPERPDRAPPGVSPALVRYTCLLMLEVVALGGLGEFGMNMLALTWGETTIVVDAGVMFPDPDLLGVDRIIPDLTYLQQNRRRRGARADARPRGSHRRRAARPAARRRADLRHAAHARARRAEARGARHRRAAADCRCGRASA